MILLESGQNAFLYRNIVWFQLLFCLRANCNIDFFHENLLTIVLFEFFLCLKIVYYENQANLTYSFKQFHSLSFFLQKKRLIYPFKTFAEISYKRICSLFFWNAKFWIQIENTSDKKYLLFIVRIQKNETNAHIIVEV